MNQSKVLGAAVVSAFLAGLCWIGQGCGGSDAFVTGETVDGSTPSDSTTPDSGNVGSDAAGGGDGSGGNDTGVAACGAACQSFADGGAFPTFIKGCTFNDNCSAVLFHRVDTCGTLLAVSYNHSETTPFNTAEGAWDSNCSGGSGDAGPTHAEDGKIVPPNGLYDGGVRRRCNNPDAGVGAGSCETYVP